MKITTLDSVLSARAIKAGVAVVTRLSDGAQCVYDGLSMNGDLSLSQSALDEIRDRMRDDRSGMINNGTLFVHVCPDARSRKHAHKHAGQRLHVDPQFNCAGMILSRP